MKTKLLLTFVLAIYLCSVTAQTDAGGTLNSNATWTIAGSPYNIISNLGVPIGITLTIEAGVIVNFNSDFQIFMQGTLKANGNKGANIIFNGNVNGNAMILFQKTNLTNSSLSYITINGNKPWVRLSNGSSDNNTGTLTINYITITNSAIYTDGSTSTAMLVINNSTLTNTTIWGIESNSEVININNCKITGGQIFSRAYNHGIYLNNDTCINTVFTTGCCGANININGSIISGASFNEEGASGMSDPNYLNINGSQIDNSLIDMHISMVNINTSDFHYDANYTKTSCIISGNGTIDSSTFKGNGGLIAIERGPAYYWYDNTKPYTITHCTFTDFGTDIKINAGTQGDGNGPVSIHFCDFLDAPSNYILINNSPYDASATDNWWGTIVTSLIDSAIYDYWDDMSFGKVNYSNFLSAPTNHSVGIQTINNSIYKITFSPNPFSQETTIKTNKSFKNSTLVVYNMQGQEVKKITNISGQEIKLSRDKLQSGIYYIHLTQDNKTISTKKIIILD
jgi:hypothetical protein